jgi:SAM-dependent methyltransferase
MELTGLAGKILTGYHEMDPSIKNFLYRNPQFYEAIYPEPDEETPQMCLRMFAKYLETPPSSILDIGCGTARDLDVLSRYCQDCWGVDYLPEMISYAKEHRPHLNLHVGDMRTVRLNRQFDAILCMGSTFMYALSETDIEETLETFRYHSHKGTLLILDIRNAASLLGSDEINDKTEFNVDYQDLHARVISVHSLDRRNQFLIRERTWHFADRAPVEDYCRYRLFFPAELRHLLSLHGFDVTGMFDNKELENSNLSGKRLYVAAKYTK